MRLRTLIIFGAGYVWGARAGRDPYLELVDRVRGFLDTDLVRDYLDRARALQPAGDATDEDSLDEEVDDEEGEPWDEEVDDEDAELSESNNGEEEAEPAEKPARSRTSARRRAPSRRRG